MAISTYTGGGYEASTDTTEVGPVAELTSRAEELGMASRAIWLAALQLNSSRLLLDHLHLTYQLVMLHETSWV